MKTKFYVLGALTLLFAACTDELQQSDNQAWEGKSTPLSINVTSTPTKTQISGNQLPANSDLGVFVTKSDGSDYLPENPYNNIKYTGTGETYADTWAVDPSTPVFLNSETATAYAYYPYQASDVSLTSIPITNDGTDWMYAESVENLDSKNATATFNLKHAMSIIRIKIERVNASDYGTISDVTIYGNGWATGATLNLKEGTIGDYTGEGSQLVKTDVGSLGASALTYDHWVVPTGNTTGMTFVVTMDGKMYQATVSNVTLSAGKVYNYKLTVSNTVGLSINAVTMMDWEDLSEIRLETELKTILTWEEAKYKDGVYGMLADGRVMVYDEASTTDQTLTGIAFVVNRKAYQLAKAAAIGTEGYPVVYWWRYNPKDIASLTNYETVDGTAKRTEGYLAGSNTPQLSKVPTEWAVGALSDFNGKANTELIIEAQSNGIEDGTLGQAVVNFRGNPEVNEGQSDWFCPACGELAFIFLKMTELNNLLSKVSGTTIVEGDYWSSTEYNSNYAWEVGTQGKVYKYGKTGANMSKLRLIREI